MKETLLNVSSARGKVYVCTPWMLMSWVNQIQCRRPLYMYLLYVRRGHTMTTVEGQLAVLGGAATRPQGETEVSNSRIFLIKNTLLSLKRDQRRASGQSVGKVNVS